MTVDSATATLHSSSTEYLNPRKTSMSPSALLLGRAKDEELKRLYKDPSKYRKNSKGNVLFWINFTLILVSPHKRAYICRDILLYIPYIIYEFTMHVIRCSF